MLYQYGVSRGANHQEKAQGFWPGWRLISLATMLAGAALSPATPAYGDATRLYGDGFDGRDNTASLVTMDLETGQVNLPLLESGRRQDSGLSQTAMAPYLLPDAIHLTLENKSSFDDRDTVVDVAVERPYGSDHAELSVKRQSVGAFILAVTLAPDRDSCVQSSRAEALSANLGALAAGHYSVRVVSGDRIYDQLNFVVKSALTVRSLAH